MLAPVIEDVSKDFKNIDFFKVNIDDNEQLATKYKIKSIPTVVLFVKNEPINKFMGFMTRDAICQ
jgi:thioredoxin 1